MDAPQPISSVLQDLITKSAGSHRQSYSSPESKAHHSLALQVSHNLRYQHNWSDIRLHHPSTSAKLPRPLVSGFPPRRLYIHPDEQLALLQQRKASGKTGLPDLQSEREWVLPTQLREKWSLKRFGEVFDRIGMIPEREGGEEVFPAEKGGGVDEGVVVDDGDGDEATSGADRSVMGDGLQVNQWRTSQPKRVLMAIVDDDSTIAYYIVHDGIVKPRQN